ncbi:hypothetical protein D3C80_1963350 [compost metagenome]
MGLSVAETFLGILEQPFKLGPVGNHLALGRSPGTQAAAQRPHLIIGIGLLCRDLFYPPFDPHLTLQGRPEESHCRKWVSLQLLALGAVIVGEKGEPLLIQPFEQ